VFDMGFLFKVGFSLFHMYSPTLGVTGGVQMKGGDAANKGSSADNMSIVKYLRETIIPSLQCWDSEKQRSHLFNVKERCSKQLCLTSSSNLG
jgi:hypothetical protein